MKSPYKTLCLICCVCWSQWSLSETLLEIYEQALENDPQLKADKAAYEAGKEAYKIARSGLLPTISASASYSDSSSETENIGDSVFGSVTFPSSDSSRDSETTSYSASLRQPLFNMSSWYSFKQGKAQSGLAEANFKAAQQSFIIRVAEAYFNVLRAIDTLETAQAEETALASQLEQTRQRFEVGLTAITDVLDAQSSYDSALANVFEARGNLGIAYEALEVLTGTSHNTVAPITEDFHKEIFCAYSWMTLE